MKKMFIILVTFVFVFALSGCTKIAPASAQTFKQKAGEAGYTIIETDDDFIVAYKGTPEDYLYSITFETCDDADSAKTTYAASKTSYENCKGSVSSYVESNLGNHNYYKLTTEGKYYVVYRVGVTFLIVSPADSEYKKEINTFLKSIGY